MNVKKIAGAAGGLSLAGLMLLPVSTAHADSAVAPNGTARAAALSVSLSPQALVDLSALNNIPSADPLGILALLKQVATSTSTISLDASNATAVLNGTRSDLVSGHAQSVALETNLAAIKSLLGQLDSLLSGIGASSVVSSLPQVTSVIDQIQQQLNTNIAGPINGVLSGLVPNVAINQVNEAFLDPQHATGGLSASPLIAFNGFVSGTLAPFQAVATDAAHAAANKQAGAIAEADNDTTKLNVGQSLNLSGLNLAALNNLLATLQSELQPVLSALQPVVNQLQPVTQPAAGVVNTALGALGGTPAAPIGQQISGLLNGGQINASQAVADLQQAVTQLTNLLTGLTELNSLASGLNLNSLVNTYDVTSQAKVQPLNGGVHSFATTIIPDVKVLQLVSDQLSSLTNGAVPSGTPLVEVKGISSSEEAFVDGKNTDAPSGSTKLAEVDVLGQKVVDTDTVLSPGTAITKTISVPNLGALTVSITRGDQQIINNTATHKTAQVAALDVRVANADANGANGITALGGTTGNVVDIPVAQTYVDAATDTSQVNAQTCVGPQCSLPKTGMFGAGAFGLAGLLGLVAISLRIVPGVGRRFRGVR